MAQLSEDEWPKDGEPTTSEQEGDRFKREGTNPPDRGGDASDGTNRATGDGRVNNVEPGRQSDKT